jgi:hypothetical protein
MKNHQVSPQEKDLLIHSAKAEVLRHIDQHLTGTIVLGDLQDLYSTSSSHRKNFETFVSKLWAETQVIVAEMNPSAAEKVA